MIKKLFLSRSLPQSLLAPGLHSKRHQVKIIFLFVIPLCFFVAASSVHIVRLSKYEQQLTVLDHLVNQAIDLGELLHELQKERGMTGIYLSSHGVSFSTKLAKQREQIDQILLQLTELMLNGKKRSKIFADAFTSLSVELKQLPMIRQQISEFNSDIFQALEYYNNLNKKLFHIISIMVKESVEPELTRNFLAYVNLLKEKEMAGIERVVLGAAFTRNLFLPGNYQYFVQLTIEQNLYRREFLALVSPAIRKKYNSLFNSAVYKKIRFYRDIAHSNSISGVFDVDSNVWFDVATDKINQLKRLEQQIAQELILKSQALKADSEFEKWLWINSVLVIMLFTMMSGIVLIRNINRSFSRRLKEYSVLFEHSSAGMAVIDLDDQNILLSNGQFATMTGYNKQQISTLKLSDMYVPGNQEQKARLCEQLAIGQINFIEKLGMVRLDGSIFFAEISTFPILISNKNYIVFNIKDLSTKLAAENKLKKSQQAVQTVLDSLNCAVSVVDHSRRELIYLNKLANKIYKDKAEAEPVWSLLSPQVCKFEDAVGKNSSVEFTEQVFNKSRKRWYQITNKAIEWHDNRTLHLRMLEDITERYDIENKNRNLLIEIRRLSLRNYRLQEQERQQLARELHDQLGQLMTGIMLQADYIHRCIKGKDQAIELSAQSIIETIQELITSVQGITNQLRPVLLDQLGLVEALRELLQQWQSINPETAFKFSAAGCPDNLPDQVAINIYRIVQESLTNACKHARASNVVVSLKFEKMAPDVENTSLVLHISDDGIGFHTDEVHFNGMGLINMRERIEVLGGTFRLLSKSGQGVDILAFIPVKAMQKEA